MLVEFKVKNFRSFREEQTLSLVASNDKALKENCISQGKLKLLKSVGVYGPNASGKSNLIKAVDTMRDIVLESATYKPDRELPIKPFLLDVASQKEPSKFEVVFYDEGTRYQYGFSATGQSIHKEWLLVYSKGMKRESAQTWYDRTSKKWKFSTFLRGEKRELKNKTRNNALFLSVAAQWNNKQLTKVYKWFENNLRIVPPREAFRPVTAEILSDVKKNKKIRPSVYEWITELLRNADLGIQGVKVKPQKLDEDKIKSPEGMPDNLREKLIKYLRDKESFKVEMLHQDTKRSKIIRFPLKEESDGTQRFFQLIGPWLQAIACGYTVLIDELETSLHPLLTRELIKLIHNPDLNKKGAQLIFATHDTTLLDSDLFRRDQIWFTEKDKTSQTILYPMSDYKERKPRKGEAMQKGYLSGRYGATPILASFGILNG